MCLSCFSGRASRIHSSRMNSNSLLKSGHVQMEPACLVNDLLTLQAKNHPLPHQINMWPVKRQHDLQTCTEKNLPRTQSSHPINKKFLPPSFLYIPLIPTNKGGKSEFTAPGIHSSWSCNKAFSFSRPYCHGFGFYVHWIVSPCLGINKKGL